MMLAGNAVPRKGRGGAQGRAGDIFAKVKAKALF
jgi:hypothetical protein